MPYGTGARRPIWRLEYIMHHSCLGGRRPIVGGRYIARPLPEFSVRVTLPDGRRINYTALAGNSIAALETALEIHGVCRIAVSPKLRSVT